MLLARPVIYVQLSASSLVHGLARLCQTLSNQLSIGVAIAMRYSVTVYALSLTTVHVYARADSARCFMSALVC